MIVVAMFFRQVLHDDLRRALAVADAGDAAVIELEMSRWRITSSWPRSTGFAIRHVLETHTHAGHVPATDACTS